jgi:hypothetical protein
MGLEGEVERLFETVAPVCALVGERLPFEVTTLKGGHVLNTIE